MKTGIRRKGGYTLLELTIALMGAGIVGAGVVAYGAFAIRLMARNMATNHGHDTVRVSAGRMISDLHGSASILRLVDFNGTSYTDANPSVTSDKDPLSSRYLSTRANAVRYFRRAGGPCRLVSDGAGASPVTPGAVSLRFDFGPAVNGALPYVPKVGDKLQLPLISREFTITAVPTAPTPASPTGTVTLSQSLGTTLYTVGPTPAGVANPITTGYFFDSVGYSVWNNQLRYHRKFPPASAADTIVVRNDVTSAKPFALLYPAAGSALTDGLNLRISLEAYDMDYGLPLFRNATTTVQAVVPSRTQPVTLTSN